VQCNHHVAVTFGPNTVTWYINGVGLGTDPSCFVGTPTGKTFTPRRYDVAANFCAAINLVNFVFESTATQWDLAQTDDLHYCGIVP
jgi:hypothetical protein